MSVIVLNQNTKRESGRKVQLGNVQAAKTIADIIRTCLGPRAMLKIQVKHPAAKSMIEISRTQDEEVGDGTTSVIILAGEFMSVAEPFLEQQMHPTQIIAAYRLAMDDMIDILKQQISRHHHCHHHHHHHPDYRQHHKHHHDQLILLNQWGDLACNIALDAVKTVALDRGDRKEIDIKSYAKVEKVPGGEIEDSKVLTGVMINKDVTHGRMKRRIENPRIMLLDCNLEYKKGESQTSLELSSDTDFSRVLQLEEEFIKKMCDEVIALKPDLVITEKGISDLAQHFLMKANITAIRRVRKTDNNRIARACGATIVNRTEELKEEDIGTGAGLFEVNKFGDEYFTFITECKNPKACTILLRGASKDVLNEVERNLQDAMNVARNVIVDPRLVPGGGACEMALAHALTEKAKLVAGVQQWPYKAVAKGLEVIPRTLIQNCGANTIRTITALRTSGGGWTVIQRRIDGQTAMLLLRIDDIVSGTKKATGAEGSESGGAPTTD
ncbi:predicted protein [Nematostella vectensis]|uniref:T-complex protein 1 subunit gamma n=1 Tax=Nematostella vectensis TaxID=45351 RepID=A7SX65_NEMVE|nr:predicted protein [Nematostella vectensis]|eukprot:XP_001623785.1 predicted protein [Nematostella vectensis]